MFNLKNLLRKNIIELEPYSSARSEYKNRAEVFLDANENPYGILNRYPDPLQQKLKQKLSDINGVSTQNIFIGNGSDEVIDLAIRIFCVPGKDRVLSFSPTYGMYKVAAAINDVEMLEVPLNSVFQIEQNSLSQTLQDPLLKIVFICSPNNPTGNCLNGIEFLLDQFKGIIVLDEAYIDFAEEHTLISRLDKYPQLIISQTLSKAWGLAAARIGIGYASSAIIDLFNKVKPPYNVSTPNQEAALKALSDVETYKSNLTAILEERLRVKIALQNIKMLTKVYSSDANFLLVETVDATAIYESLLHRGIVLRNRNQVVRNCIRISIGTREENDKLIDAMLQIQSSLL